MSYYKEIISRLLSGDPSPLEDPMLIVKVNKDIEDILMLENLLQEDVEDLGDIIHLANIVYNNIPMDDDDLFIDNGIYDMLVSLYSQYNKHPQVGAEPIQFMYEPKPSFGKKDMIQLVSYIEDAGLYNEELMPYVPVYGGNRRLPLVTWCGEPTGKKLRITSHGNPTLVGTLDKSKFVLVANTPEEAQKDPKVGILERDFFGKHFLMGIINMNTYFRIVMELKYDGVSVVCTVKDKKVVMAVSRGDTGMDAAVDYTPIFYGYTFPAAPYGMEVDLKCEAIMTYGDLAKFCEVRGYNYKNARSAIIGLTGLNDGYKYRDFVTLVPLKVAHSSMTEGSERIEDMFDNRIEEIEFLNKYFITNEPLRYGIAEGNYVGVMYQINAFVDGAEKIRPDMPIQYDGVVVSYAERQYEYALGRENFINKWSIAVKFRTLKRVTRLFGISYTVGQNGVITPMAHYQAIEFNGTIHSKSSISSVKRFNENLFKVGNFIQVEYINDVMPYVSTPPDLAETNKKNPNPVISFTKVCPCCGSELQFSDKSAVCINPYCEGRQVARMANMMSKLGIKGFAEETMRKLQISSLHKLSKVTRDYVIERLNSEIIADNLMAAINALMTTHVYDYIIVGALGFTNVAQGTWKLIFQEYTLPELYVFAQNRYIMGETLKEIRGIGAVTADTIVKEWDFFAEDIRAIIEWGIAIDSKGIQQKKIRITGFRDPDLIKMLCDMGYDASDKAVTKDTYILLIPYIGFSSNKVKAAGQSTNIIPVDEFKANMEQWV